MRMAYPPTMASSLSRELLVENGCNSVADLKTKKEPRTPLATKVYARSGLLAYLFELLLRQTK